MKTHYAVQNKNSLNPSHAVFSKSLAYATVMR